MAYDPVTNRLFVANEGGAGNGQITFINLDGSGAGAFSAPGAPVEEPEGVAIDPATRTIYWINTDTQNDLLGAPRRQRRRRSEHHRCDSRRRVPDWRSTRSAGRVYWGNNIGGVASVSFANVNNSGGGNLNITGATPPESDRRDRGRSGRGPRLLAVTTVETSLVREPRRWRRRRREH